MDSLKRLIAEGFVIQTEFSQPRKRQTSPSIGSKRTLPETRSISKSPLKPEAYKSPVKDWRHHAEHYEAVRTVQLLEDSRTPEVTPETRRIWKRWKEESVEDRLLRLERERQERVRALRDRAQLRETDFPFSPTINTSTQSRPADVSLHLYTQGLAKKKKRDCVADLRLNSQLSVALKGDNERGIAGKSPVRRALNMFSKSQLPLRDFLARNYWGQMHKFKRNTGGDCSLDSECVFHPVINASYTERQSRDDVYERLTTKQRLSQSRTYEKSLELRESESSKCTFQPRLHARAYTPPPQSLSAHKKPLKSQSPAARPCTPHRPAGNTQKEGVFYVDNQMKRVELVARHCSGRWKELAELEEVEGRMQALGVVYR